MVHEKLNGLRRDEIHKSHWNAHLSPSFDLCAQLKSCYEDSLRVVFFHGISAGKACGVMLALIVFLVPHACSKSLQAAVFLHSDNDFAVCSGLISRLRNFHRSNMRP